MCRAAFLQLLAATGVVTTITENFGNVTGAPFGRYAFLACAGLPHVGRVPLIVGPFHVGMGYLSWAIANLPLTGRVARPAAPCRLSRLPVAAAFVMEQWDVPEAGCVAPDIRRRRRVDLRTT